MTDLFEAALAVQSFCDRRGWRFCFIGGLAVQRWGEPRVTRHVDLTLLTGFHDNVSMIDTLLEAFSGRISDAMDFALRNRVLLLKTPGDIGSTCRWAHFRLNNDSSSGPRSTR